MSLDAILLPLLTTRIVHEPRHACHLYIYIYIYERERVVTHGPCVTSLESGNAWAVVFFKGHVLIKDIWKTIS